MRRNKKKFVPFISLKMIVAALLSVGVISAAFSADKDGENPSGEKVFRAKAESLPVNIKDGPRAIAKFNLPNDLAFDSAGNLYVADGGNNVVRKIGIDGMVTTYAGQAGILGAANGNRDKSTFERPTGIAVDKWGNVFVADAGNDTIRTISPLGFVDLIAGWVGHAGKANGIGVAAHFFGPHDIAVDDLGNLYVSDSSNNAIRKISKDRVVTTLAGKSDTGLPYIDFSGSDDGFGQAARFSYPNGLAVDARRNIYVADCGNSVIRKITPAGVVSTIAGRAGQTGSADGVGDGARFNCPTGIAVNGRGIVFVSDENNKIIRKIDESGVVTTIAGKAGQFGQDDGVGADARFMSPAGLALDREGNIFVADSSAGNIRKINLDGVVSLYAGQRFSLNGN